MSFGKRLKTAVLSLALMLVPASALAAHGQAAEVGAGIATDGSLVTFPVDSPGTVTENTITFPMGATDTDLVGIDYRPRGGGLYAVASGGTFYVLAPGTAAGTFAATRINDTPLLPTFGGDQIGFDFNPAPDAIRLVTDNGEDYRYSPNNGSKLGTDGNLAYAPGDVNEGETANVVAAAYTNSKDGTGGMATTLYEIDSVQDVLVTQGSVNATPVSPNTGQLFTVGAIGADATDNVGLDIAPASGIAFAAVEAAGSTGTSTLHQINLETGAATPVGDIGGGKVLESVAVAPASVVGFASSAVSVDERAGTAELVVSRVGGLNREVSVDYSSTGDGAPVTGTLTFPVNVASQVIEVPVENTPASGSDRIVEITLAGPTANAIIGENGVSTLNVIDTSAIAGPGQSGSPVALVSVRTSRIGQVAGNGKFRAAFSCDRACGATMTVRFGGRAIGRATGVLNSAGKLPVLISIKPGQRQFVKNKARGRKAIQLNLVSRFTADGVPVSTQKMKVRITR